MKRVTPLGEDDRKIASDICTDRGWTRQEKTWLASYDAYETRRGNPKRLLKAKLRPSIEGELYKLYEGGDGSRISSRIREDLATGACPMCGSACTGTVDHFLPRKHFPEFAIFTPNLVPACALCNMFTKRMSFKGPLVHEHLLHPHYDRILDFPIWEVAFRGSLKAVKFEAVPLARLSPTVSRRVRFHLSCVLGREFRKTMRKLWSNHPEGVATAAHKRSLKRLTRAFFVSQTDTQLDYASAGTNHNSWQAAFLRGVLADSAAVDHMRGVAAQKLTELNTR